MLASAYQWCSNTEHKERKDRLELRYIQEYLIFHIDNKGGANDETIIVVKSGTGDPSLNPERGFLHLTKR